jgi:hypothetical protein
MDVGSLWIRLPRKSISTGAANKDKLGAANLAKLVYEQLSIDMKAELEE